MLTLQVTHPNGTFWAWNRLVWGFVKPAMISLYPRGIVSENKFNEVNWIISIDWFFFSDDHS